MEQAFQRILTGDSAKLSAEEEPAFVLDLKIPTVYT